MSVLIMAPADGYNDHDCDAIQVFLETLSSDGVTKNGAVINASYNPDDPSTWTGVTWNSDAEKRVTHISWTGLSSVAGALDLSDFTSLTVLDCSDNALTALDVSGCAGLEALLL